MISDVIGKLAAMQIFIIAPRNKFVSADAEIATLPSTALGRICMIHAIVKSYGQGITLTAKEFSERSGSPMPSFGYRWGTKLKSLGLVDTIHSGRTVSYQIPSNARDLLPKPCYIVIGETAAGGYLLSSPRLPQNLEQHKAALVRLGLLEENQLLKHGYLMLGYEYDKYFNPNAAWSWASDTIAYFASDRNHYKLKAAWLAMNSVKYLPNHFEAVKTDFWDVMTPSYITTINVATLKNSTIPNWDNMPQGFFNEDTPDEDRIVMLRESKAQATPETAISPQHNAGPLRTPLAELGRLKFTDSAKKTQLGKIVESAAKYNAGESGAVNVSQNNGVLSGDKSQGDISVGNNAEISSEDNLVDDKGIQEESENAKLNRTDEERKAFVKKVLPTVDFVPPISAPEYDPGFRRFTQPKSIVISESAGTPKMEPKAEIKPEPKPEIKPTLTDKLHRKVESAPSGTRIPVANAGQRKPYTKPGLGLTAVEAVSELLNSNMSLDAKEWILRNLLK